MPHSYASGTLLLVDYVGIIDKEYRGLNESQKLTLLRICAFL